MCVFQVFAHLLISHQIFSPFSKQQSYYSFRLLIMSLAWDKIADHWLRDRRSFSFHAFVHPSVTPSVPRMYIIYKLNGLYRLQHLWVTGSVSHHFCRTNLKFYLWASIICRLKLYWTFIYLIQIYQIWSYFKIEKKIIIIIKIEIIEAYSNF